MKEAKKGQLVKKLLSDSAWSIAGLVLMNVTAQFAVTTKAGTLTIRPRTVTLTSVSAGKTYDGTALTTPNDDGTAVAIGGDGFAEAEGVLFTMTGTRTTPGESENSFTYLFTDNTKPGNYEITTVFGALSP